MSIPLTDELLLLGYDDASGKPPLSTDELDLALAPVALVAPSAATTVAVSGS